jgi:hypothetical protein
LLRDGQLWMIPISAFAPHRLTLNPINGEEMRVPDAVYKEFTDRSYELFSHFLSQGFQQELAGRTQWRIPRGLNYASLALSQNYRVNTVVVDLLGLIGEWEVSQIAAVSTSLLLYQRLANQKKTTECASPSSQSS